MPPSFLCIGLQRAGTRWLYQQLKYHPQCWMPPIKELRFFYSQFPRLADIERLTNLQTDDAKTITFTEFMQSLLGTQVWGNLDVYERLFDFAGGCITGDISPDYGGLPDEVIGKLASRYPSLRIVLLLRNPISRIWSSANNAARRGRGGFTEAVLTLPGMKAFLADQRVRPLSFPTEIYRRWSRHFSPQQLRYFFLDDLIASPEAARANVLGFLGADPALQSGDLPAGYNSKSRFASATMPDDVASLLAEFFEAELVACARMFGGPAQTWLQDK